MIRAGWDAAYEWLTLTRHASRGLAVTRIVLGFIIASQLAVNWPDRSYTWGEGAGWATSVRESRSWPWFFGIYLDAGSTTFDLLYAVTIVCGLLLMVGMWTRFAAAASLILWMSLYVTNPYVGSGGDAVLRMVLLYACFTNMGQYLSVDAWRARRRGARRLWLPDWLTTSVHNLAVILIIHQVVMVYVGSALWKAQSPLWQDGIATYFPLQTQAYSPWLELIHPLSSSSLVIHAATWSALVIQLLFPVLLLYRSTRVLALVAITGMHMGIGLLMGIMYFSLVMIAVDMMLIRDQTWSAFARFVRTARKRQQV